MVGAGTPSGIAPVTTVVFRMVRSGRESDVEAAAREASRKVKNVVGHRGVDVVAPPPGATFLRLARGVRLGLEE